MPDPTSLELRQRLIGILRREIGTVEHGRNTGPRIIEYQRATSHEGTGWAWCAAFLCWGIKQWLRDADVRNALKLTVNEAEKWRPKTAAAYGFEDWGRENGLRLLTDSPSNEIHTADIVTFDISHVGIVITDDTASRVLHTIEGNTGPTGEREGEGVWQKERPLSLARRFIRILP